MITKTDMVVYSTALLLSFGAHASLLKGLGGAAQRARGRRAPVEFSLVKSPPPPPVVEPPKEEPKPKKKVPPPPPPKEVDLTKVALVDIKETPPPSNTAHPKEPVETAPPIFGVSMSSVVGPGSGSGISVRVGNTLMKEREEEVTPPAEVKPYVAPLVALHKVTKLPKRQGRCRGIYPSEAKAMGIEGAIRLEVQVNADGTVGQVKVVEGIGYGLDEAAVRALKLCRFEPAVVGGQAVATRIPYTYRFIIED